MRDTAAQVFPGGAGSQSKFLLLRNPSLVVLLFLGVVTSSGPAQIGTRSSRTVYRLNQDSTFEQGCYAPCECPVMVDFGVRGTLLLTPTGFDGQFNTYAVEDVRWVVSVGGTDKLYTGQGTYKVSEVQQELSLYLQEDGGTVQHFDSGLVQQSTPFPDIKVTISIHGQVCYDTVFGVSASPVHLTMAAAGANVILTWPTNTNELTLQSTTNLVSGAVWTPVSPGPVVVNGQNVVTNPISGAHQFYRLSR